MLTRVLALPCMSAVAGQCQQRRLSQDALHAAVDKALTIARYTSPDPYAGLADAALMARDVPDLDLYHPWSLDADAAIAIAKRCEDAGFAVDERIDNSEGASVSASESEFVYANSHGFCRATKGSAHYIGCAMVASDGDAMERDDWYTSHRVPNALDAAEDVGRIAGERAVARLNPRKLRPRTPRSSLTPQLAGGFLGHAISALFGGSLYRKTSFLLDSIGKPVFAPLVDIVDDPFIAQAYASSPFDQEGELPASRHRRKGVVRGYFVGVFCAQARHAVHR